MKPLASALVIAALALSASACGDGAQSAGPPPPPGDIAPPATAPTELPTVTAPVQGPQGKEVSLEVWFARPEIEGQSASNPKLFVTRRTIEATDAVGAAAINELLAGPTGEEAAAGVSSVVPPDTRLLGLNIEDGLATVDLSSEFESGGGSLSMQMRLAQVVYTLTQFPTVKRVQFWLDGEPVRVFSGEGIVLDKPVTGADYEELMPAILVTTPAIGDRIASPVLVKGNANVFEANVTVKIVNAAGKELGGDFVTATCGTGCRCDFSLTLSFRPQPAGTKGFVVVQDDDAADQGFPPHQVRIPVEFG